MSKLEYNRTHRMLLKSTEEDFKYYTTEIDINSGTFKKVTVKSSDTTIRVKNEVFGEAIVLGKLQSLTIKDIEQIESKFNKVRAAKEWHPVEFRKNKEVDDEVSSTSEVQREEKA